MDGSKKRAWSALELAYLKDHYADLSTDKLKLNLGRGWDAIAEQAKKLGLKRNRYRTWTPLERDYVLNHRNDDIAELANVTCHSVEDIRDYLSSLVSKDPVGDLRRANASVSEPQSIPYNERVDGRAHLQLDDSSSDRRYTTELTLTTNKRTKK